MAQGDATYARGNVDWPFDPRCQSLPNNDCRWLHEVMWRVCVKERRPEIPPKYSRKWFSWATNISETDVDNYFTVLVEAGLIYISTNNLPVVKGVMENHIKLKWVGKYPDTQPVPNPYPTDIQPIRVQNDQNREGEGEGEYTPLPPQVGADSDLTQESAFVFPTKGGVWTLTPALLEEYSETYPALDVEQIAREAIQWLKSNPGRAPIQGRRFFTNWCNKASGKSRGNGRNHNTGSSMGVDGMYGTHEATEEEMERVMRGFRGGTQPQ